LRISALVFRKRVEEDLEDEVGFHLIMARRKPRKAAHIDPIQTLRYD
jgi:hypothetical protein